MNLKTKLDLKYSSISITDAIITLGFFFSTCNMVIQKLPQGLKGLLFLIIYASISLLSCVVRNIHLLKKYCEESKKIKQEKVYSKSDFYIYLFPFFAVISCILSLSVIL